MVPHRQPSLHLLQTSQELPGNAMPVSSQVCVCNRPGNAGRKHLHHKSVLQSHSSHPTRMPPVPPQGTRAQVRDGVIMAVGSDGSPASLLQPLFVPQHTRLAGTQPFQLAQHPLCGAVLLPQPPSSRLSWSRFTVQSIIEPNSCVSFIWSYKFQEKAGPMVSALVQR